MTAPAPTREDAAPQGAVVLSEREAIDTLRVIAAMHGGFVSSMLLWPQNEPTFNANSSRVIDIGLCLLGGGEHFTAEYRRRFRWMWFRSSKELRWQRIDDADSRGVVLSGGRIDRGLGANP